MTLDEKFASSKSWHSRKVFERLSVNKKYIAEKYSVKILK